MFGAFFTGIPTEYQPISLNPSLRFRMHASSHAFIPFHSLISCKTIISCFLSSAAWKVQRCICLSILSNRSALTFTDPSEEDLGLYTVEMSDNPNLSSSYDFTAEGKLKYSIRFGNCLVQFTTSPQTQWQKHSSTESFLVILKKLTAAGIAGLIWRVIKLFSQANN